MKLVNHVLALEHCTRCHGAGETELYGRWVFDQNGKKRLYRVVVCPCVYRRVFRACVNRYRAIRASHGAGAGAVNLERPGLMVGMKGVEYLADVELVAGRALAGPELRLRWNVFRLHFAMGADWRACVRLLKIDRGYFFSQVYCVEQILGRAFLELEPYSLWPHAYFSGHYLPELQFGPLGSQVRNDDGHKAERRRGAERWLDLGELTPEADDYRPRFNAFSYRRADAAD